MNVAKVLVSPPKIRSPSAEKTTTELAFEVKSPCEIKSPSSSLILRIFPAPVVISDVPVTVIIFAPVSNVPVVNVKLPPIPKADVAATVPVEVISKSLKLMPAEETVPAPSKEILPVPGVSVPPVADQLPAIVWVAEPVTNVPLLIVKLPSKFIGSLLVKFKEPPVISKFPPILRPELITLFAPIFSIVRLL